MAHGRFELILGLCLDVKLEVRGDGVGVCAEGFSEIVSSRLSVCHQQYVPCGSAS